MTPLRTLLTTLALLAAGTLHAHDNQPHGASAPAGGHHHDHGASIGEPGDPAKVARTVDVDMTDNMRFTPASIDARQGETIRFVVRNSGQLKHEFVLGTEKALKEHYELMKKFPEMEHADPNMVTVQPGKTGEVVWRFTKAGKVQFGCLQPGHYEAGMKGQVQVAAGSTGASAAALTDGEVKKVDKENGKVTLRHGEIKNLGMPGMTMVFKVKDAAALDRLQPGDKVRFAAEKADGGLVVTQIEPAR